MLLRRNSSKNYKQFQQVNILKLIAAGGVEPEYGLDSVLAVRPTCTVNSDRWHVDFATYILLCR